MKNSVYNENQSNRLFQLRLKSEQSLFNNNNLFLVAESILILACISLIDSISRNNTILIGLFVFGILLTIIWLLTNHRLRISFDSVREQTLIACPEYKNIVKNRSTRGVSSKLLLFFGVPLLFLTLWFYLLFEIIFV